MSQLKEEDHAAVKGTPPGYFLLALLVGFLLDRFVFSWSINLAGNTSQWLRWGLLLIGLAIFIASARQFSAQGEDLSPTTTTNKLIKTGPYRFSRNPLYLSVGFIQAAISLFLGTWWGVIMVLPAWVTAQYLAIIPEEAYLEEKLGEEYLAYKKEVRRWI